MWPALESKLQRFRELEAKLSDPTVSADHARFTAAAKEHAGLSKLIKPYLEFQQIEEAIQGAEALAAEPDPEMRAMAEEELAALRPRYDALKEKIEDQLLVDP